MTVHNLLEARTRRQQAAMTFETDHEALLFAAHCLDELRQTAASPAELDRSTLQLKLDQAADIVRACIRLHATESHTTGDRP